MIAGVETGMRGTMPGHPAGSARILHIAPHLQGTLGKAHAALLEAARTSRGAIRRTLHTYVLLETPADTSQIDRITSAGGRVVVQPDARKMADLVEAADIVQLEWTGASSLPSLLTHTPLPAMRLVLWVHGTGTGLVPPGLLALADRTFLAHASTGKAVPLAPALEPPPEALGFANACFGLAPVDRPACPTRPLTYGCCAPLDAATLDPRFFDVIDAASTGIRVSLWGTPDKTGPIAARAAAMRHPERIVFEREAFDPQTVLSKLDVLIHLLDPTRADPCEAPLVEAMSVGATPLVWRHGPEASVVREGRNALLAETVEDAAALLDWTRSNPRRVAKLGAKAMYDMAQSHIPANTLRTFARAYTAIGLMPPRRHDFQAALTARDWAGLTPAIPAVDGAHMPFSAAQTVPLLAEA